MVSSVKQPNGEELKKQRSSENKVRYPSAVAFEDHIKNLGFSKGCDTLMFVSDKKAKFPGKSLYTLGRSWLKEAVTEKDKSASIEMPKKQKSDKSDLDDEAKGYLKEFVEKAKAAKNLSRMTKKKEKMVQKQILSTSAPRGKKKSARKIRSLNDIIMSLDQEGDS